MAAAASEAGRWTRVAHDTAAAALNSCNNKTFLLSWEPERKKGDDDDSKKMKTFTAATKTF